MKLNTQRSIGGNTLVVTLMTMATVAVFIKLALSYTSAVNRNVQRSILWREAINIGDSATEMQFSAWRALCRANQTHILKRSEIDTEIPTPSPSFFPNSVAYTLSNYSVYPLNSVWTTVSTGGSTPCPISGPNHGDLSYYYLGSADVTVTTLSSTTSTSTIVAKVRRVFQKEQLSLWRYAIFYNDDMEIHPGPPMNVTGDVHTNGSLYTGHATLTLSGKTTYTDTWSIGFMAGDNTHPETPTSPTWATGLPPASDQAQQPYGVYLSDYHQLIDYTTSSTPLDPYRFQTQASYVVTIDATNTVKVYKSDGSNITSNAQGTAIRSAITTNQTITDNREGATTGNASIRLATVDVSVLTTKINNNTINNFNGVLYIVDTSADPNGVTAKRGIRLKNGGTLPNTGLTIASGNPVYVQGDYNTGTTAVLQPLSNSGVPTSNTVTGYTAKPAAIVADAVNILSNSWVDANSGSVPAASATTVNAAMVSGIVPTGSGYYSGGVENFPRFLENWGSKSFTYYGSMIELYNSKQAIGRWGANNVYSPPDRYWYFDKSFVSSPPPGLLASFNYRRSRWYML